MLEKAILEKHKIYWKALVVLESRRSSQGGCAPLHPPPRSAPETSVHWGNQQVRPKYLRRNPPDVGVTSRQKPCTKIIYIVLQTSVGLFQLSSQNNSFLATPNVENECWTSYETLKSSGEMKLMMKFCLFPQNHCTLKFSFSRSRGKLFFGVISGNYLCI